MNFVTCSLQLKSFCRNLLPVFLAMMLVLIGLVPSSPAEQVADVTVGSGGIYVTASIPGATFMMLRVADPQGQMIFDQSSDGSSIGWFPTAGAQDGLYKWEVRVGIAEIRGERDEAQHSEPRIRPLTQSGTVFIQGGAIVPPFEEEASLLKDISSLAKIGFAQFMDFLVAPAFADQVILDDLIVDGSECVGNDCVNGESFGFDTIRLKENNLQINFEDTSNISSYPTNDWRIVINDSTDGGASYFAIQDATGGRTPFKIEAGAPNSSLYVDDYGNLGVGTAIPQVEIHTLDGDTPTLRLDQDGSHGWAPQIWDVAGNETNFFIRDVTNGSLLPFRIIPGAPHNSLYIHSRGDVGLGSTNPQARLHVLGDVQIDGEISSNTPAEAALHVLRNDGTAQVFVQEQSSTVQKRFLLGLENNGAPGFFFINSDSGDQWQFSQDSRGYFIVSLAGTGGSEFKVCKDGRVVMGPGGSASFDLRPSGNLIIAGTLTQKSDVNAKENFAAVEGKEVLDRVRELPISTWNFKTDATKARHLGPMAQDFYAAFRLGEDNKHMSPMDAAGVALAAIQEVVREKDLQIEELKARLVALELKLNSLTQSISKDD
jgi:hypothetical protein